MVGGQRVIGFFQSIPPPPPSIKPKKEVKIFVAAYTYDAANKDELSFKEGQKIEFIEDLEDGWATGKLLDNGIIGLYPTNFVEVCLGKIPRIYQFFLQTGFEILVSLEVLTYRYVSNIKYKSNLLRPIKSFKPEKIKL